MANYFGLYATDQIDATDKLKLRFSARQNWWNSSLTPDVTVPKQPPFGPNQPFLAVRHLHATISHSIGALARFISLRVPFALFRRVEESSANFSAEAPAASVQAPEAALQYEAGVKVDALDNRLELTLAGFNVDRQNVFTLVNDEANFSSQYTRGIDADLQFSVTPDWKIIANGTLQRAVLTANPSTRPPSEECRLACRCTSPICGRRTILDSYDFPTSQPDSVWNIAVRFRRSAQHG